MYSFRRLISPSLLLLGTHLAFSSPAFGQTIGEASGELIRVIKPESQSVDSQTAKIDTEKFQAGLFFGALSADEFSINWLRGMSLTYHPTSHWIAQIDAATSNIDKATFEGDRDFIAKNQRDFRYLSLSAGYQIAGGRSFRKRQHRFHSHFYALAGISQFEFAGQEETGATIGFSYRGVLTDWMTFSVNIKDHIVKRDFLDNNKITHNTEISWGLSALF